MAIRELLVPVRGDGMGESLLQNAINLAQRFNAHIDVVHCRPKPNDFLSFDVGIPAGLREQIEKSASGAADADETYLREIFNRFANDHDLSICDTRPWPTDKTTARWREEVGKQPDVIEKVGHLVDMLVLARPNKSTGLGYRTLEAALLYSGRPVMLAPPERVLDPIGRHILIGWHGGTETARAIGMMMPLLEAADRLTLVEVVSKPGSASTVESAADHLREHRFNVSVEVRQGSGTRVAQTLLQTAEEVDADSLLIGAYGQSRRLEFVFGGVTHHIIEHAELPVFMTH